MGVFGPPAEVSAGGPSTIKIALSWTAHLLTPQQVGQILLPTRGRRSFPYHKWPNYLKIVVDIGNLAIATTFLCLALGCITVLTVGMSFLVETQSEKELQRLFGAVKVCQMEMNSTTFVDNTRPLRKVLPCKDESKNEDE
ncbi:protein of unknown function-containing protein [Forsythia ovata]|uniref:Protein ENHANCED DISEASE RESISTANCE 2 C-terminal domain-containing protein n=1 Tax=Forsythia ovata TaxID=205694 RepID=A0ABD1WHB8_9LAMI